jgi:hypothetical protein
MLQKMKYALRRQKEFKGLESDVVIYLTHEFTDIPSSTIDKRRNMLLSLVQGIIYIY